MNQIPPSSIELIKEEEKIETSRTRNENDRAVMAYNASQLNTMAAATTISHEDIPLQHFSLTNVHPRPTGLNLPTPRSIPPRQPNPVFNQSQASISGVRVQGTRMKYLLNEPCLGAEGGYDPRETASGLNGLPRSKSVRLGIEQRFLRNEARSGNTAVSMPRHNSVACINDIPFLPSTHYYTDIALSSRENIDEPLLGEGVLCNTRSDDIAMPMVRHNTVACINDVPLLPPTHHKASMGGLGSRENPYDRLLGNEASCNTRSDDMALPMVRHNTMACINDVPLWSSIHHKASVGGFSSRENLDDRLLGNEASCNTRSDDIPLPMVRHNTMACINDIHFLPAIPSEASTGGVNSRENINRKFQAHKASCNTRSSDIALQMLKLNSVKSISNIPLLASKQSNASVEGFNPKRKRKSSKQAHKERHRQDIMQETGDSDCMDITINLSESKTDMWEDCQTGNRCQMLLFLTMIAFVASLAGAALYSLIGCSMIGCKMEI